MKKRWIAAGMLEAERSFRRIKGYTAMPSFVEALRHGSTFSGVLANPQVDGGAAGGCFHYA